MSSVAYSRFLESKMQDGGSYGFTPNELPGFLFDFQKALVEWALVKGRAAIFADCGLGKTPMQLVWADQIVRKTNRHVLILTPLAVGAQTVREGAKFGIECVRSSDGKPPASARIVVTNYERLHHFDPADFVGVVCDESSILKNFDGTRKAEVTEFMRLMPYRLLCTATASPNDYIELGTSAEAIGVMGYVDMLNRFFKNTNSTIDLKGRYKGFAAPRAFTGQHWRFKHHAEQPFWRWVCSWARACRRPSDLGFEDGSFILPELTETEHVVRAARPRGGLLFDMPAVGLREQREERRITITERCERAAELSAAHDVSISWCHLNPEGDLLERLIPGAVQVSGADDDDAKEEKLLAFLAGDFRALVSKPVVAGFGLNLQNCAHVTTFPSHSFESYYQSVRRCWRFGQERPVTVDIITTEGERGVMANLRRKADAADKMFSALVGYMNESLRIERSDDFKTKVEVPAWL